MFTEEAITYQDLGGTFRARGAEETLAMLKTMLSKFGITRVSDVTGLDLTTLPVAACIRPGSKHLSVSQGKGRTLLLAKISAIMESIEGYHVEHPPKSVLYGNYADLSKQYKLLNPSKYARDVFSHKDFEKINYDWILAYDYFSHERCYLPLALVRLDSVNSCPPDSFLKSSSNGLAAGNTYEEALCHAFYELIERDSLSSWQLLSEAEKNNTKIKLSSITDDIVLSIIKKLNEKNIAIEIWDVSSKLSIPTFHCAILSTSKVEKLSLFTGSGAHIDKGVALSRAVFEALQTRLTVISGSRDDIFPDFYELQHKLTTIDYSDGIKDYSQIKRNDYGNTFAEHLGFIKAELLASNYNEVYVVDHTKPQFAIPVVQIFIPKMNFSGARIHVE